MRVPSESLSIDDRHLDWEGCFNVRDLGGLPAESGRSPRWGALVRADALDGLTEAGWRALPAHGVGTVIDLRNDDEQGPDTAVRPEHITTIHIPLDASEDREFWNVWQTGPQFGTPLYYGPHLDRFPDRSVAVINAVADAKPGGVVFHCGGGRGRAGQVAMLLLSLAGVSPKVIAADYALSFERLPARYPSRGEEDQGPLTWSFLKDHCRSSHRRSAVGARRRGASAQGRPNRATRGRRVHSAYRRVGQLTGRVIKPRHNQQRDRLREAVSQSNGQRTARQPARTWAYRDSSLLRRSLR
jgi:protein tyrosine/serine phosphatase